MSMRITTGMIAGQYSSNLRSLQNTMNTKLTHAYTYRAFDKASDNPLKASQAYEIQWEMDLNNNYQNNLSNVTSAAKTAESTLESVSSILTSAGSSEVLQSITGTMNDADRKAVATQLLNMRDSILSDMNGRYANQYLFAGAGNTGAPFTLDSDGNLLYRGINVDTGENTNGASVALTTDTGTTQINFGKDIGNKLNGYTINISTGSSDSVGVDSTNKAINISFASATPSKGDLQAALRSLGSTTLSGVDFSNVTVAGNADDKVTAESTPQTITPGTDKITDMVDLSKLANESVFVDVGLGMTTDSNGNIIAQSAYNSSMPGISFLGYGTTTKTDTQGNSQTVPKNIYSILTQIADKLNSGVSGQDLMNAVDPLIDSFEDSQDNFTTQLAKVGTNIDFLDDTSTYLQSMNLNLLDKDNDVEFLNPADAIMDYTQTEYSYEAALKAGSQILQKTLMDFLN